MGINGLSKAVGPGETTALATLVNEKLQNSQRPLRIAIDISIWLFESQKGQGGWNPQLRTLYFRFVRLLRASVQPLFVFDGPAKPPFKRNKATESSSDFRLVILAKKLISIFGFHYHDAPGEAEAECAFLQRHGIVDAVLSEDVDTLMFGCTLRLRNAVSTKQTQAFSSVSVFDLAKIKSVDPGMDSRGMILIALMSGGDYLPEGIPGCGIKIASEAARAGYGETLHSISMDDSEGIAAWKEDLIHQLRTNEEKHFRTKHAALKIPDDFPRMDVMEYYRQPAISSETQLSGYKEIFVWKTALDVSGLHDFVREHFKWGADQGPGKFIKLLAPALLVSKLWAGMHGDDLRLGQEALRTSLDLSICGQRPNPLDDSIIELRVAYSPAKVVELDANFALIASSQERDENDEEEELEDLSKPARMWISKTLLSICLPRLLEDYEKSVEEKAALKAAQKTKSTRKKTVVSSGPMDRFVKVTKNVSAGSPSKPASNEPLPAASSGSSIQRSPVRRRGTSSRSRKTTSLNTPDQQKLPWAVDKFGVTPQPRVKDTESFSDTDTLVPLPETSLASSPTAVPAERARRTRASNQPSTAVDILEISDDGSDAEAVTAPRQSTRSRTGASRRPPPRNHLPLIHHPPAEAASPLLEPMSSLPPIALDADTATASSASPPSRRVLNKRVYIPRSSLEGAWTEVDAATLAEDVRSGDIFGHGGLRRRRERQARAWRVSEVSVVDLTET